MRISAHSTLGITLDNATTATEISTHQPKPSIIDRIKGINRLFLFTVAIPTLLSTIYFGLIASNVYISESKFVIYSPGQSFSASGLGSILGNISGNSSSNATYAIHDYIDSWDAMHALDKTYDLKSIYGNHQIDIFNRFGGLLYPFVNNVELHRYYQSKVLDSIDSTSNISKLTTRAYSAADAQKINVFLLQKSQNLVNQLNTDARQKAVLYAQNQVDIAKQNLRNATINLAQYRNAQKIYSPTEQSALQLTMVAKLQDQLLASKSQLEAIRSHAPNNPQISSLEGNVRLLESQINEQTGKVSGSSQSMASKDVKYTGLQVDQVIAQKLLEAVTSFEQAKITSQKQEFYLETISQPNLPDAAQEPKRFQNILATLLVSLIVWGVLTIVIAGVKEHHDR
jgi:capsular polysaccharide transport system permease protein